MIFINFIIHGLCFPTVLLKDAIIISFVLRIDEAGLIEECYKKG